MRHALIVTCEHADNRIPLQYSRLFSNAREALNTHRGYDIGAKSVYRTLCRRLRPDFSLAFDYTRLLIDVNRNERSHTLLSSFSRRLTQKEKTGLIRDLYAPYRRSILQAVKRLSADRSVIHLSVHSFTPVLNGYRRDVDVGLLYDPGRITEAAICRIIRREICDAVTGIRVCMNRPYRGTSDGITSWLRSRFPMDVYCGIELEINQEFLKD